MIDYERDYIFDYFGIKTLERAYLIKIKNEIIERPQDMFMRVASFLNQGDLENTKKTYDLISNGFYTHATPTLFNSGNKRSQLSSCFLLGTHDSLEGITHTWDSVSKISKWGGGIGLHVSNIRAKDSLIRGTNGPSSGIIPMLKVYNEIARYINQGGKRKGSIAIYLEP
jgi:ribonucleotide reductase alpha subunit